MAGTDAVRFSINEDGELTFKSSPDYEAPNDANTNNVYEVTIRASDGNLMSTLDVEVTVTDANESGAITGPTSIDYPENSTTTVATYSITDPEATATSHGAWQAQTQRASPSTRAGNSHSDRRQTTKPRTTPIQTTCTR